MIFLGDIVAKGPDSVDVVSASTPLRFRSPCLAAMVYFLDLWWFIRDSMLRPRDVDGRSSVILVPRSMPGLWCVQVRLAREIGALSVRGNHENEVIRWSRAMALGAQSNFKSEHYLIALALSEEDLEWLRSLPWYISCR